MKKMILVLFVFIIVISLNSIVYGKTIYENETAEIEGKSSFSGIVLSSEETKELLSSASPLESDFISNYAQYVKEALSKYKKIKIKHKTGKRSFRWLVEIKVEENNEIVIETWDGNYYPKQTCIKRNNMKPECVYIK